MKILNCESTDSTYQHAKLAQLRESFPMISEVRGAGMMAGLQMSFPAEGMADQAMEQGLLINCTHDTVIRLLPPFIAKRADVDEALEILGQVSSEIQEFASQG